MGNGRGAMAGIVLLVALAAIAAGAMYLAIPAHSLPSFMPGHRAGDLGKYTKRGIAGMAVGGVLLVISIAMMSTGRGHGRYHR